MSSVEEHVNRRTEEAAGDSKFSTDDVIAVGTEVGKRAVAFAATMPIVGPVAKCVESLISLAETHSCNMEACLRLTDQLYCFVQLLSGRDGIVQISADRPSNQTLVLFVDRIEETLDEAIHEIGKFNRRGKLLSFLQGATAQDTFDQLAVRLNNQLLEMSVALLATVINEQQQTYRAISTVATVQNDMHIVANNMYVTMLREGRVAVKIRTIRYNTIPSDTPQGKIWLDSHFQTLRYRFNLHTLPGLACLRHFAHCGDPMAQALVALTFVGVNQPAAVKYALQCKNWIQNQADSNCKYAQYAKGFLMTAGVAFLINEVHGVAYLEMAAEQAYAPALAHMGLRYLDGDGVHKEVNEGMRCLLAAAEQRDAVALIQLATRCFKGDGVPQNSQEALRYSMLGANQGIPYAQMFLGLCYEEGIGVTKSPEEAVRHFRTAAAQGWPFAQGILGMCYQQGCGVAKDEQEAVRLFTLAADEGDEFAQHQLGLCNQNGVGVVINLLEAERSLQLAASQGEAHAQQALTWLSLMHRFCCLYYAVLLLGMVYTLIVAQDPSLCWWFLRLEVGFIMGFLCVTSLIESSDWTLSSALEYCVALTLYSLTKLKMQFLRRSV